MISLRCSVKNYDWGKKGSKSLVARLMKQQDANFVIDENLSYAEVIIFFIRSCSDHILLIGEIFNTINC